MLVGGSQSRGYRLFLTLMAEYTYSLRFYGCGWKADTDSLGFGGCYHRFNRCKCDYLEKGISCQPGEALKIHASVSCSTFSSGSCSSNTAMRTKSSARLEVVCSFVPSCNAANSCPSSLYIGLRKYKVNTWAFPLSYGKFLLSIRR